MFKGGDLQSRFRIFVADCRIFPIIKILVVLLVTDLISSTKNYFFLAQCFLLLTINNTIKHDRAQTRIVFE